MDALHDFLESIYSVIRTMGPWDIVDIALLSGIIFYFYNLVRETRAGQLFKGIAFLLVVYGFGKIVELKAITYLLERLFSFGVLAILIVFQPEVRRAVEKLGHNQIGINALRLMGGGSADDASVWTAPITEIGKACADLSSTKTGALIVIERHTRLGEYIGNGTIINADVSSMLLGNLFFKNSPLHDGAIILRGGRIHAGGCQLPKPQKEEWIDKNLGSRHRAAIGMSENSDAVVIVVSEETGYISIAENGALTRNITRRKLEEILRSRLIPDVSKQKLAYRLRNLKPFRKETESEEEAGSENAAPDVWYKSGTPEGGDAHGSEDED